MDKTEIKTPVKFTEIPGNTLFLHEVLASGTFKLQGKDTEYEIWMPIPKTSIILTFKKGRNRRKLRLGLRDIMGGFMDALDKIDDTERRKK